jgi:nitric oxide reductase large subunit
MKKLWIAFVLVLLVSFSILGWIGTRIYQEMPPIPDRVVTTDGQVVVPSGDIERGQNVWQSMGGMEVGSIWGHGSYVAPDWTADWLHRELTFVLDDWSKAQYCSLNDPDTLDELDATGAQALTWAQWVVAHLTLHAARVDPIATRYTRSSRISSRIAW